MLVDIYFTSEFDQCFSHRQIWSHVSGDGSRHWFPEYPNEAPNGGPVPWCPVYSSSAYNTRRWMDVCESYWGIPYDDLAFMHKDDVAYAVNEMRRSLY